MKKVLSVDDYKSLLVIITGFLILNQIFQLKILFFVAIVVAVLSLIWKGFAIWILWLWNKIALVLGWINTRIILGAVFYVFLTPIAFITRLFTKNILQLKKIQKSYYVERNHKFKPNDLDKTW